MFVCACPCCSIDFQLVFLFISCADALRHLQHFQFSVKILSSEQTIKEAFASCSILRRKLVSFVMIMVVCFSTTLLNYIIYVFPFFSEHFQYACFCFVFRFAVNMVGLFCCCCCCNMFFVLLLPIHKCLCTYIHMCVHVFVQIPMMNHFFAWI